jgi:glycosyltransferase involved in cell wall biosynthesis
LIHGILYRVGSWRGKHWPKATSEGLRKGDFVVSAFFRESLGIGRAGRLSTEAFKAAGYSVIEHDLRTSFKHWLSGGAPLPGSGGVWYIHANATEDVVALMAHPPQSWADRYRIAYWAWETPKAPAHWLAIADFLHEIWVPSAYVHAAVTKMFTAAGRNDLVPRVRIMPHPVPLATASPVTEDRVRFGLKPDVCEVLAMFDTKSSAERKNPWGAVDAWVRAFPEPETTARLTLKVSDLNSDGATRRRLVEVLMRRPDIRVIAERFNDADMEAFIAAFDVLLSLHRSEGFGLSLAEAMAAGVPVIATAGSGNADFMAADNARLIPAKLIRVDDRNGPYLGLESDPDQVWGDPDIDAAAGALRELVRSAETRHTLAGRARAAIPALNAPWQKAKLKTLPFNKWL